MSESETTLRHVTHASASRLSPGVPLTIRRYLARSDVEIASDATGTRTLHVDVIYSSDAD
eukprot:3880450-Karenia_brevis.AAC.1